MVGYRWGLPDLDLSEVTPFTAAQTGRGITDPVLRRRTRELVVLLEMCRHPPEDSHARQVEDEVARRCIELGAVLRATAPGSLGSAYDWCRVERADNVESSARWWSRPAATT